MTATYNGWTNYETWNVSLWLDNDQGTYSDALAMAQDAWDEAEGGRVFTREEEARNALADRLKDYVESLPEIEPVINGSSLASDLLGAALSEVNWREIADHYLSDVDKEEEDGDEGEDDDEA
jgi:hypothetical protein